MKRTPILVTGGTGTLGQLVVARLRETGHAVRVLSRHGRAATDAVEYLKGDLRNDEGIEAAVDGAEIIIHLAGGAKGDDEATRNLVRAASAAGAKHLVSISVIGADRLPIGYFRSKLGAERAVAGSGLPFTTLRAAQFHDLVLTVAQKLAKLPVIPIPSAIRLQPVDTNEVAARLVELALGEPAGRVPDLAGPEIHPMRYLVREYLRAHGQRRLIIPVPLAGRIGRAYKAGENLSHHATEGRRSWQNFLAARVGTPTGASQVPRVSQRVG